MAKKAVATLNKGNAKKLTKLVYAKRSHKTGAYTFRTTILPAETVKDFVGKIH